MRKVSILLDSIEKVKKFVSIVTKFEEDCDLVSGRYIIDAKSIMGILSMNLSKPLELQIHSENSTNWDKLDTAISEFVV